MRGDILMVIYKISKVCPECNSQDFTKSHDECYICMGCCTVYDSADNLKTIDYEDLKENGTN